MPAAYSISATAAYPSVDAYGLANGAFAGPFTYGSRLVVTTDLGPSGPYAPSYFDTASQRYKPLAGRLSVSVCIDQGNLPTPGGR
ncbi:MAG: hypothetical protein U1F10_09800 [Burkholderiales bacterium]